MKFSEPKLALLPFDDLAGGSLFLVDLRMRESRAVVAALKVSPDNRGSSCYVILSAGARPGGQYPLRRATSGFHVLVPEPTATIEVPTTPADVVLADENTDLALSIGPRDTRLIVHDEYYRLEFDIVTGEMAAQQRFDETRLYLANWKVVIASAEGMQRRVICEVDGRKSN
jgi:hypothetical protein